MVWEGERARQREGADARKCKREGERVREGSVSPATGWLVERTDTD